MGIIHNRFADFKGWFAARERELFIVVFVILTGFFCYAVLRLAQIESEKALVRIEHISEPSPSSYERLDGQVGQALDEIGQAGFVVGAFAGNVYHYPWCAGALRIKEENKIWFKNIAEAENRGYRPAKNCKGLSP